MSIADELITHGWTQKTVQGTNGKMCLYGAALSAAGLLDNYLDRQDAMYECTFIFRCLSDVIGEPVTAWNDRDARTYDEVLRAAKEVDEYFDAIKELGAAD